MEEKERYEWDKIEEECYEWIRDTETVNQSLYYYLKTVAHLLNQQDKRIKELELLLKADKKIETNSLNGFEKLRKENQQLKQQLHDLPKKIVEDFYDEIRHRAILEDDYCPDHNLERKYGVRKCLLEDIRTTILKKY